jgi:hypothetical protein
MIMQCASTKWWTHFASCSPTALDANLSLISVSQNKDTKRLAAWAAIIAAPTAIAGIYGMNFQFMPELSWRYGYEAVLGGMAMLCGGLWLGFKRSGGCKRARIQAAGSGPCTESSRPQYKAFSALQLTFWPPRKSERASLGLPYGSCLRAQSPSTQRLNSITALS